MAIAIILEYEVGVPVPQRTQHSAQTILNSTVKDGKVVTTVTLGVTIYVPFDGEKMILRNNNNTKIQQNGKNNKDNDEEEELGIELPLRFDDVCTILSPKPLFSDIDSTGKNTGKQQGKRKVITDMKSADRKSKHKEDSINDNSDSDIGEKTSSVMSGIKIAFDLSVIDSLRGNVIKDDEWIPSGISDMGDREDEQDGRSVNNERSMMNSSSRASVRAPRRDSTINSRKGISISTAQRKRRVGDDTGGYDSDDAYSVSESIVGGDSEASNLLLDPHLYTVRREREVRPEYQENVDASSQPSSQFAVPRDKRSLMAQTMQGKLNHSDAAKQGVYKSNDVLEDNDREYHTPSDPRLMSFASAAMKSRSAITLISANSTHSRELTRGARSRLGRHGFDGTMMDSNYDNQPVDRNQIANHLFQKGASPVDIDLEARDLLAMHDISIQFAGYRIGPAAAPKDGTSDIYPHPTAVYFSYQFYSCQPTRTEVMRLLSSDKGQVSVLCRDQAHVRDEAPLSLRYLIDCSDASPTEAFEFAEYMAHTSLFVDIWDANSLMLLGTCSVPLRRIMRQGQTVAKCAVECDVIDAETSARTVGGITTSVILSGGSCVGTVIGAVQVILSNRGDKGKHQKSRAIINGANGGNSLSGLNWRAHQDDRNKALESFSALKGKNRPRPKVSVRARPLSENTPELSQALHDHRQTDGHNDGRSMRSLSSARGQEGARTLTYDDVAILFKRFQGDVKGTVQYSGTLMTLLDIPSWSAALKKLVKVYHLGAEGKGLDKVKFYNSFIRS